MLPFSGRSGFYILVKSSLELRSNNVMCEWPLMHLSHQRNILVWSRCGNNNQSWISDLKIDSLLEVMGYWNGFGDVFEISQRIIGILKLFCCFVWDLLAIGETICDLRRKQTKLFYDNIFVDIQFGSAEFCWSHLMYLSVRWVTM